MRREIDPNPIDGIAFGTREILGEILPVVPDITPGRILTHVKSFANLTPANLSCPKKMLVDECEPLEATDIPALGFHQSLCILPQIFDLPQIFSINQRFVQVKGSPVKPSPYR